MTATTPDNLYLSPDQQDLLLAALTSNTTSSPMFAPGLSHHIAGAGVPAQQHQQQRDNNNPRSYTHGSPETLPTTEFPHDTPLLDRGMDYGDWDAEFDQDGTWDYDPGTDLMQDTPHPTSNDGNETTNGDTPHPSYNGDKRKEPPNGDGADDPHESEPKRRGA